MPFEASNGHLRELCSFVRLRARSLFRSNPLETEREPQFFRAPAARQLLQLLHFYRIPRPRQTFTLLQPNRQTFTQPPSYGVGTCCRWFAPPELHRCPCRPLEHVRTGFRAANGQISRILYFFPCNSDTHRLTAAVWRSSQRARRLT